MFLLKSIKKNALFLIFLYLGTLLSAIMAFILQVTIARNVSPSVLGNYSALLLFITTLAPLCGFGIPQYLLKVYGQYGSNGKYWLKPSLHFSMLSTTAVLIFLGIWSIITHDDVDLKAASLIMSFIVIGQVMSEITSCLLQLQEKYLFLSFWQSLQNLLRLFFVILIVTLFNTKLDIYNISIAFFISSLILTILGCIKIYNFLKLNPKKDKYFISNTEILNQITIVNIFKESLPFGLAGLFYLIYYQTSIIMIKYLIDAENAGFYSVSFTIISATLILPAVIYQKFLLPKLHKWAYHDKNKFRTVYYKGNYIMLGLGIITMIIVYTACPYFIPFIFGDQYLKSIEITQYLSLSIPVIYVASNAGSTLVTKDHMRYKVKYMGISALLNIIINYYLLTEIGLYGAIYATFVCNIFLLISYLNANRKYIFIKE